MSARRPSLTARMADQLDRMAYALDILPKLITDERQNLTDLNTPRESFEPSAARMAAEARALVVEHQKRSRS